MERVDEVWQNKIENDAKGLRIAWIGSPSEGGGVGGFCRQLLQGLNRSPVDLTVFSICEPAEFDRFFRSEGKTPRHVPTRLNWSWNRWYSRNHLSVFLSSFCARRRAYSDLIRAIVRENRRRPFDVIVQFSQSEIFEAASHLKTLPPFIIFPCVHAAGELFWHRAESAIALRSESRMKHWCVRAVTARRAKLQASTYRKVYGVIGMSERFNELVRKDYGVDTRDQAVVYQPLPSVTKSSESYRHGGDRIRVVFVGRISVRKGIEMLVELSRRVSDLRDQVEILIIGDRSFWSDYSALLGDFDAGFVRVLGALPHDQVMKELAASDILIVPSHYEPGGIVVAEGLSSGCLVIASNEVGSAELLEPPVCLKYPHADLNGLENVFREAIRQVHEGGLELRRLAQATAANVFAPEKTQTQLLNVLISAAKGRRIGDQSDQSQLDVRRSSPTSS
jgi:glycosyltransferase involved in cell wall biosynthesis